MPRVARPTVPRARVSGDRGGEVFWRQACKDDVTIRPVMYEVRWRRGILSRRDGGQKKPEERRDRKSIQSHGLPLLESPNITSGVASCGSPKQFRFPLVNDVREANVRRYPRRSGMISLSL